MARPDTSADGSRRIALPIKLPHHPAVLEEQKRRADDIQLRIADWITGFAGSMNFVYLHVLLFAVWMLLIERSPWPTLTLIVSLEAIFLSTFVMIGQNRQSEFQQAKADHDFQVAEHSIEEIHRVVKLLYASLIEPGSGHGPGPAPGSSDGPATGTPPAEAAP